MLMVIYQAACYERRHHARQPIQTEIRVQDNEIRYDGTDFWEIFENLSTSFNYDAPEVVVGFDSGQET